MQLTADRCATECLHPEQVRPLLGRVVAVGDAEQVAATFDVLADATRVRIVHALSLTDELCVCDMALVLGISQSGLSHQLRMLRERRVVTRRRAGRVMYYHLADEHVRHMLQDGMRHAREPRAKAARAG